MNRQSRDAGNIGYTRHRAKTNTTQKQNTENKKDGQHGPHQIPEVNLGAREGYAVAASYKTLAMLLIEPRRVGHHYIRKKHK